MDEDKNARDQGFTREVELLLKSYLQNVELRLEPDEHIGIAFVLITDNANVSCIVGPQCTEYLIAGITNLLKYAMEVAQAHDPEGLEEFMDEFMPKLLSTPGTKEMLIKKVLALANSKKNSS